MNKTLSLFWSSQKVGSLWLTKGGDFVFQYDAEWIASLGLPISIRLPIRKEPFETDDAKIFFSNLLPEGAVRELIAKRLGVSGKNDFRLLEELGGECAGALSLLPEGSAPNQTGRYEPISDTELEKMIEEMPYKTLMAARGNVRLSLAGAQHKLAVYVKDGEIFLPHGAYSSSHILKPEISGYEDTVFNEYFCMRLARECGLVVPEVEFKKTKYPVLLIKRYDRRSDAGRIIRLHQEDFCQALGYGYDQKYESEGGPSFKKCFALLEDKSAEPILDKRSLLRWVLFNFLIGNGDAHGKNLSVLISEEGIRLAPFYDLMSTAVYQGLSDKMAMKIGGKNRADLVVKRHWERFADDAGVGFKAVAGIGQDLKETLPDAAHKLEEDFNAQCGDSPIVRKIVKNLNKRVELLHRSL